MENVMVSLAKFQPLGIPSPDVWKVEVVEKPPAADIPPGHFLMRLLYVSVDASISFKVRLPGGEGDYCGHVIGKPIEGFLCGVVEGTGSQCTRFRKGDILSGLGRYVKYQVIKEEECHLNIANGLCDDHPSYLLGCLGIPGCVAWAGLKYKLKPKAGQVLFVSAAAGAVGSIVGQLAKLQGLKVIGSTGSAAKCDKLVKEYGFDAAFNYKDVHTPADITAKLLEASPEGIDLYFDNVGGILLQGAMDALKVGGRAVICGLISYYNASTLHMVPCPAHLLLLKQIRIEGISVFDFLADPAVVALWQAEMWHMLRERVIKFDEMEFDVDRFGEAVAALFLGQNVGKLVVKM
eukprot:jgi/Mesvir1/9269/Mv03132-RA.1